MKSMIPIIVSDSPRRNGTEYAQIKDCGHPPAGQWIGVFNSTKP